MEKRPSVCQGCWSERVLTLLLLRPSKLFPSGYVTVRFDQSWVPFYRVCPSVHPLYCAFMNCWIWRSRCVFVNRGERFQYCDVLTSFHETIEVNNVIFFFMTLRLHWRGGVEEKTYKSGREWINVYWPDAVLWPYLDLWTKHDLSMALTFDWSSWLTKSFGVILTKVAKWRFSFVITPVWIFIFFDFVLNWVK